MILVCTQEFGNFAPDDEVEVPDGAAFDTAYFKAKDPTATAPAETVEVAPDEDEPR